MTLTLAQQKLLESILDHRKPVSPYYQPAQELVSFGLAKWVAQTYEGTHLEITEKGKKLFNEKGDAA